MTHAGWPFPPDPAPMSSDAVPFASIVASDVGSAMGVVLVGVRTHACRRRVTAPPATPSRPEWAASRA